MSPEARLVFLRAEKAVARREGAWPPALAASSLSDLLELQAASCPLGLPRALSPAEAGVLAAVPFIFRSLQLQGLHRQPWGVSTPELRKISDLAHQEKWPGRPQPPLLAGPGPGSGGLAVGRIQASPFL